MLIPVISLFCGCGGFDLGFAQAGFQVMLALDNDPIVIKSYNHNRKSAVAELTDLSTTSGTQVINMMRNKTDLAPRGVIGGSPCQSFSKGNAYSKQDDSKHILPRKYAEIITEINDKHDLDFFVFENVHGITFEKHKKLLPNLLLCLKTLVSTFSTDF